LIKTFHTENYFYNVWKVKKYTNWVFSQAVLGTFLGKFSESGNSVQTHPACTYLVHNRKHIQHWIPILDFLAISSSASRSATRCVCEKNAQNVSQPIFLSKFSHNYYRGKRGTTVRATCVIFKKYSQNKTIAQYVEFCPYW
jgi:hypothetical protein